MGINNGGVGFLADIPNDRIEEYIARIRRGEYTIVERPKLDTYLNGRKLETAVNETVIHTDSVAKIRSFRVRVDGHIATELRADGLIISTPVGSTSYAMSLGAPMIDPSVDAFVIVPIAAYKFASRPFIVPAGSSISVEILKDRGCIVVVDGQAEHPAPAGSLIECVRSASNFRYLDLGTDFYSRVRDKLVNNI